MLSPVSLCQVASPLYAWTKLKLLETSSRSHFSPSNLKLRLLGKKWHQSLVKEDSCPLPRVPEQALTRRAREPKYLYRKGWDEETGLEPAGKEQEPVAWIMPQGHQGKTKAGSISRICRAVLQGSGGTSCHAMAPSAWEGKPSGYPKESKHCRASRSTRHCQYWNQSCLLVLPRRSQTWGPRLWQKTNPKTVYPRVRAAVIMPKDRTKSNQRSLHWHGTIATVP